MSMDPHLPTGMISNYNLLDSSGPLYNPHKKYTTSSYRWFIMFLLFVGNVTVQILWCSFAPIVKEAAQYYGKTQTFIDTLSVVYPIAYLPGTLLAGWLIPRIGLRSSFILGYFTFTVQGVLRWLSAGEKGGLEARNHGWIFILCAQCLGGMIQPLVLNSTPRVATLWFPAHQRDIAIAVGSSFQILGIAAGQILPQVFVQNDTPKGMDDLLLATFIIPSACFVLFLLFFREKPKEPPSFSAEVLAQTENSLSDFSRCLRLPKMRWLTLAFGIGLGIFNASTTLVEQLVSGKGYTSDNASNLGTALAGAGLVAVYIVGPLMDIFHRYIMFLRVCITGTLAALVLNLAFLTNDASHHGAFTLLCVSWGMMGFFTVPCLPLCIEMGVELCYPVHEDVPTGILMGFGNVVTVPMIYFLVWLNNQEKETCTWVTCYSKFAMIAFLVPAVAICWCIQPVYRRQEAERDRSGTSDFAAGGIQSKGEEDLT